jgi:protein-L-isoaspartate(D-aspartate) O-methyltransferase
MSYSDLQRPGHLVYDTTEDADPRHIYHNVLVAIDAARELNNGEPASLARWLDALELRAGDRVVHMGCGTGYYTAIIAPVVGPRGSVLAIEVDLELAARAEASLARYRQVRVLQGDGTAYDPGPVDAIFANAGLTHPPAVWLDRVVDGGRLLIPLTTAIGGAAGSAGLMLKATRVGPADFAARFVSPVGIFASIRGRDPELEGRLRMAIASGRWHELRSLRRDAHAPHESCWLHGDGFCLSRTEV